VRRTGSPERERSTKERNRILSFAGERDGAPEREMEHRRGLVSDIGLGSGIFSGELYAGLRRLEDEF
jgi:hypothetical protein